MSLDWTEYEHRFRQAALRADGRRKFDVAYIERCLAYAKPLVEQGVPIIYDQYHLARLVGYNTTYLYGVSNAARRYYRSYTIPKVSGGTRTITEPLPSLKEIQRWILDNILSSIPVHPFAKGFVKNRSIRDNARYHQRQPLVLTLDIEKFFGYVTSAAVTKIFLDLGYTGRVAVLLSRLCTLDGSLPQGAPTSPALSNLSVLVVDKRISAYARKQRIRYTRYADDLTFSGQFKASKLISYVRTVLRESGFRLNESKTRLMERHQRQETTGIVVNQKLQVPREVRRRIRQQCWYIERFGLESHLAQTRNERKNHVSHLLGVVAYILFINPQDPDGRKALSLLSPLLKTREDEMLSDDVGA
jgi:RNA-directed DNA polymerase